MRKPKGRTRQDTMRSTVTLNGQITIPAAIRKRLGIAYRDTVTFVYTRGGQVRLVFTRRRATLPAATRPRLHVRGDEFMRLLEAHLAQRNPTAVAPFF